MSLDEIKAAIGKLESEQNSEGIWEFELSISQKYVTAKGWKSPYNGFELAVAQTVEEAVSKLRALIPDSAALAAMYRKEAEELLKKADKLEPVSFP